MDVKVSEFIVRKKSHQHLDDQTKEASSASHVNKQ